MDSYVPNFGNRDGRARQEATEERQPRSTQKPADVAVESDEHAAFPLVCKNLRACLNCKLIKAEAQFVEQGCDNCGGNGDVQNWSTPLYTGMVAMMNPHKSWVARKQGLTALLPGMYAMEVSGKLMDDRDGY